MNGHAVGAAALAAVLVNGAFALPPVTWVVSSLDRVGQHDTPGTTQSVQIFAARGECQSFQVAIAVPPAGLQNTNLTSSEFRSESGATIPRSSVTIYREHYVHVTHSSPNWNGANQPLGPGWYADGLVAMAGPIKPAAGVNQPFWVDVCVPRRAASQRYQGSLLLQSSEGSTTIAVELQVWHFELPLKPALLSSFGYAGDLRRDIAETLLAHRVMPQKVSPCRGDQAPCPMNIPTEQQLADQWGLNAVDVGFWSGASYGDCHMAPPPSPTAARQAVSVHTASVLRYNFTADEIGGCPDLTPNILAWSRVLHAAGIKNLITMIPQPALLDDGTGRSAVDIWVMTAKMYDSARSQLNAAREHGATFWSYASLVQDAYSPKWEIDFLPIDYRITPGFLSQSLGLTGILYWRTNSWPRDPWQSEIDNTGQFAPGASYPGEGFLLYPAERFGNPGGVLPSLRLKQIRDGVTDYDYVQLLKERGREQWALEIVRAAASDWEHWTRDSTKLLAIRQKLGTEIERLSTSVH